MRFLHKLSFKQIYSYRLYSTMIQSYFVENKQYINVADILDEIKEYKSNNPKSRKYKSVKSKKELVDKYGLEHIFGRIINDQLTITQKYSMKLGSIYISKDSYDTTFGDKPELLAELPDLIQDNDLVFFKDDDGITHNVEMRGTRTKDGIYFKVSDISTVFKMRTLVDTLTRSSTSYTIDNHYKYFTLSKTDNVCYRRGKELYLTYEGLMKVITNSRSGIAWQFKQWINNIVFTVNWGTTDDKITLSKKMLNVDADHLKAIMSKSATNLSCLYLIDIQKNDNNKKIYKYGFTDNIRRRFNDHLKTYGDDIKLDQFILIPYLDLSKAETEFKNSTSRYKYSSGTNQELISLCSESYINIKNIFRTISDKYCGNMRNQISHYEREIMELKHQIDLKDKIIELKDKEIENLTLRLKICKLENDN